MLNMFLESLIELAFGLAFLLLVLRYFAASRAKVFFLVVLIFLFISKFQVLFFPPYGDIVSGAMVEAAWLSENSFDYLGLSNQPAFWFGGPKVYLISIYPGFQALLMKVIPGSKLFILINHLLTFVLSSGIVVLVRRLLLKIVDEKIALIGAVLLLSLPLFSVQIEQINMEIPTIFFSVLSAYFLTKKKILNASIAASLAALIKGTCILVCGAVFVCGLFLFLFDKKLRFKVVTLLKTLPGVITALVILYFSMFVLYDKGQVPMLGFSKGWDVMKGLWVFYLFVACGLVFVCRFIYLRFVSKVENALSSFIENNYVSFVMFVYCCSWVGLFLCSRWIQHRYKVLLLPFLLVLVIDLFNKFVSSVRIKMFVSIFAVVFALICSYGLLYPNIEYEAHSAYERSLEYRNNLKGHIETAKFIENNFSKYTIGAQFTIAHLLAYPEFGYVNKKLDVMMYNYNSSLDRIKNFTELKDLDIKSTLWVGFVTSLGEPFKSMLKYPFGDNDKLVKKFNYGSGEMTLFMGGFEIEKMRLIKKEIIKIKGLRHIGKK